MALIRVYKGVAPKIDDSVFLAENATIVGDVEIGADASIWFGTVIRADVGRVRIGHSVNIQDLCCIHMTTNLSHTHIEDSVSIGHGVIIHGARVDRGTLVGMGSIVMDNAHIGEECIIGAGSLVTAGTIIPPRSLALGRPARVVRPLREDEWGAGRKTADSYVLHGREHALAQPESVQSK